MSRTVLSGKGIVKKFGEVTVLDHIDIDIYDGDFTVIMGSSGAGKSTLLYALSRMDDITEGRIELGGEDITKLPDRKLSRLRAEKFGFIFQQMNLADDLTLYENVITAGFLAGKMTEKRVRERAESLLEQMNVSGAKDRLPSSVSGGEAQRAAAARAVINEPEILFADEPTGALNRKNSDDMLDLLTSLNENGQRIVMVTHDIRAAMRGNRVLYICDGRIIGDLSVGMYEKRAEKQREALLSEWLRSVEW